MFPNFFFRRHSGRKKKRVNSTSGKGRKMRRKTEHGRKCSFTGVNHESIGGSHVTWNGSDEGLEVSELLTSAVWKNDNVFKCTIVPFSLNEKKKTRPKGFFFPYKGEKYQKLTKQSGFQPFVHHQRCMP